MTAYDNDARGAIPIWLPRYSWRALGLLLVSALSGCAGISYKTVHTGQDDAASPPRGAFAFSLSTSSVLVTQGSSAANPKATQGPVKCGKDQSTTDCLSGVTEAAAPGAASAIYFVTPDHVHFGGTQLTPKLGTGNPLLLQSVSFDYNNQVANMIGAAGTGAAAGFVFGPWGAVIGGIGGLGGAALNGGLYSAPVPSATKCSADSPAYKTFAEAYQEAGNTAEQLVLPVSLSISLDPNQTCWVPLPGPAGSGNSVNNGWFYEVTMSSVKSSDASNMPPVLSADNAKALLGVQSPISQVFGSNKNTVAYDAAKFPFETAATYFADTKVDESSFPASACVAVQVMIARHQDLSPDGTLSANEGVAVTTLTVADPDIVQVVQWSSGSTVTLLPCGAYASTGAPSTAVTDDVNALIKQAQAVKSAQQQWKSSKK
jgi:hypothetical protein